MIDISPYKLSQGHLPRPDHVQIAPMPDMFKGKYRGADAGKLFAEEVCAACTRIQEQHRGVAAFFCESLMGPAGQIRFPDDFLAVAASHVRRAGGVYIADEVQVGLGRMGCTMWGFEIYEHVVPDILTLAKGLGNGYPIGCVVTTRAIANSFMTGMEYFNTTGGSNAAMAAGRAVLNVIRAENLQENANRMGALFVQQLLALKAKYPGVIGDVRGCGLFLGIELTCDGVPATDLCRQIQMKFRTDGILIGTDGLENNVLKIKPPLWYVPPAEDCVCVLLFFFF